MVIALLLKETDKQAGCDEAYVNPAVTQCVNLMDELFAMNDEPARNEMVNRITKHRKKLTAKVADFATINCLVGSLELYTSGFIASRPGTRLDYVIQTFRTNLPAIKRSLPTDEKQIAEASKELKARIRKLA